MKRLVCLIFALTMLAAAGCKPSEKEDAPSNDPPSNIKSYAEKGRLDSLSELKIGDLPKRVAAFYHTTPEALDSPPGSVSSAPEPSGESEAAASGEASSAEELPGVPALQKYGEGIVCLQATDMQYYYDEDDAEAGILMMVAFRDSYMLTLDATTPEIVRAMAGKPAREGEGGADTWFFLATGGGESHYMEYQYGDYRVGFYFADNLLMAVSLCHGKKWDAARAAHGEGASSVPDASSAAG